MKHTEFDTEQREAIRIKLAAAVAAKLRYWAAIRELEQLLVEPYTFENLDDDQSEALNDYIGELCFGIDDPDSADTCVMQIEADYLLNLIYGKPK
jgi:hypothetical protein